MTSWGSVLGLATIALLWQLGYLSPTHLVIWSLLAILFGDIVTAIAFESLAPTEITLGPGEKFERDSELNLTATVVSGFAGTRTGYVRVNGESWAARLAEGEPQSVAPGRRVSITGRDGLTLTIVGKGDEAH